MSLEYGWAWCRGAGRSEAIASLESLALKEDELASHFFHHSMPFLLMYVGIPQRPLRSFCSV